MSSNHTSLSPSLPAPHGGILVDLLADPDDAARWREKAKGAPVLRLTSGGISDLECIATGVYSPLDGFLGEGDHAAVVEEMRLESGVVWSLPITLPATEDLAREALRAGLVLLADRHGHGIAVLEVRGSFRPDVDRESDLVYGTGERAHPGVAALHAAPPMRLAGPVTLLEPIRHEAFASERLTPAETRAAFAERGWRSVVGFQTRNPVHRAHEYIQKIALEIVDGLLLHPLVGDTKSDDVPAAVRMRCYRELLDGYYPPGRVLLSVFPAAMRYAGPREAIVHAIARKNHGCTHFIVGRDHAGVGTYYGTYDAQRIFDRFSPEEIGITILPFEHAFFCRVCDSMATPRTCPHPPEDRVALSGSAVRSMLAEGKAPPPEFSRPEVAQILIEAARNG